MTNITLKEFLVLTEARQSGVKYTEKQVKNAVDRVTATLSGAQAGSMTKIAKRYARLEVSLKALKDKHTELNTKIKGEFVELFDAEDVVLTRVVETSQFTLTMAKEIQKTEGTSEVDYESIVKALSALIDDSLQPAVDKIIEKFTKAIPAKAPIKKLSVSKEVGGGIVEGVLDTLKSWFKSIMTWATGYDAKLAALKKQAGLKVTEALDNRNDRGLYGELSGEDSEKKKMWNVVFKAVKKATKDEDTVIRDYLDSAHGRHMGDNHTDAEYIKSDFAKFKKKYNPEDYE